MNISQQNSHHSATLPISLSHSFIPLACAEFDDSLLFSGASSIPLYHILFPATLLHQLFFHPPSPHLAIYFLAYYIHFNITRKQQDNENRIFIKDSVLVV